MERRRRRSGRTGATEPSLLRLRLNELGREVDQADAKAGGGGNWQCRTAVTELARVRAENTEEGLGGTGGGGAQTQTE